MHIEAIVIRKRPVREHDQLVVLYSRELGKLQAVAKSSLRGHSRQALALDEGSIIRCELVDGKTGHIMTGAQSLQSLSNAKRSPIPWTAVQFFLQATDVLVYDAQPDEALWACLYETLLALNRTGDDGVLEEYRAGQRRLLGVLGYGAHAAVQTQRGRSVLDEQFESIAQRRLSAIDLFYDVAATSRTW